MIEINEIEQYMFDEFQLAYDNAHSRELLSNILNFANENMFSNSSKKLFLLEVVPEINEIEVDWFIYGKEFK